MKEITVYAIGTKVKIGSVGDAGSKAIVVSVRVQPVDSVWYECGWFDGTTSTWKTEWMPEFLVQPLPGDADSWKIGFRGECHIQAKIIEGAE